ncbi:peptidylprolyl isomerase [Pelagicoccus sp. SDUM812002]|uniref:peptidylprolyl isomerase n=1 Tax=Pelagicoccus sp. SDUM812002 TaxID=3041266 RepID=UPI00280F94C7|nr:peptidylprolyl isomerase [Pelagicoccus sp. SDUM812002]MDQ8184049.1 peptidylprolyl isomerase [Pelagicoccus sp. SDUM812002]
MRTNPNINCIALSATLSLLFLFAGCTKKETQLHATIDTSMGPIVVRLLDKDAPKTVENFVALADGSKLLAEGEDASTAKPFYDGLTFHRVIPDFMIQGGDPAGNGSGGPGYTFEDETYTEGEPLTGEIADQDRAEFVFEQWIVPHLREHRGESPIEFIAKLFGEMQQAQGFDPMYDVTVEELAEALEKEQPIVGRGELINSVDYGTLCMANAGPNTNGSQFFIVTKDGGTPWLNGKHTVFGTVISGMDVAEAISQVPTKAQNMPVEPVIINSIRVNEVKVVVEEKDEEETKS